MNAGVSLETRRLQTQQTGVFRHSVYVHRRILRKIVETCPWRQVRHLFIRYGSIFSILLNKTTEQFYISNNHAHTPQQRCSCRLYVLIFLIVRTVYDSSNCTLYVSNFCGQTRNGGARRSEAPLVYSSTLFFHKRGIRRGGLTSGMVEGVLWSSLEAPSATALPSGALRNHRG